MITHAHSDHARAGSGAYLCHRLTVPLLELRLGPGRYEGVEWGNPVTINGVRVSLHPAGHIIGSSQVRIEYQSRVWVVTGDYKTEDDGISGAFEPVNCEVLVTEVNVRATDLSLEATGGNLPVGPGMGGRESRAGEDVRVDCIQPWEGPTFVDLSGAGRDDDIRTRGDLERPSGFGRRRGEFAPGSTGRAGHAKGAFPGSGGDRAPGIGGFALDAEVSAVFSGDLQRLDASAGKRAAPKRGCRVCHE